MEKFTYSYPTKVYFGKGAAADALKQELPEVGKTVMLTYGEGYYTFGDMFKAGVIPAVIFCVCMVLWVPFICGVLGL